MVTRQKLASLHTSWPDLLESEPLKLDKLLNLIILANEFGYSVKSAHELKSGDHAILAEIYSVWYAIEHDLLIFAHNIPSLIQLNRRKYAEGLLDGNHMNSELYTV